MTKNKIYAYRLMGIDNHAFYFDEHVAESLFCPKCGCVVDYDYIPQTISPNNKLDVGYTYDGRLMVSGRFKSFMETLSADVAYIKVNEKKDLYLMRPHKIITYDALQKTNLCELCGQYQNQVVPYPAFLEEKKEVIEEGVFATSIGFGSGRAIYAGVVLGVKTAEVVKRVAKEQKFRGLELSAVEYFERCVPVMVTRKSE